MLVSGDAYDHQQIEGCRVF